jgi:hypothetical protein
MGSVRLTVAVFYVRARRTGDPLGSARDDKARVVAYLQFHESDGKKDLPIRFADFR